MTLMAGIDELTPREIDVVRLLMAGVISDRELAEQLGVTEHTVHYHIAMIIRKLEVTSRGAVVAWGYRSGVEPAA